MRAVVAFLLAAVFSSSCASERALSVAEAGLHVPEPRNDHLGGGEATDPPSRSEEVDAREEVGVDDDPEVVRPDGADPVYSLETTSGPQDGTPSPKQIRRARHFRSRTSILDVAAFPTYIFELPWYPIRYGVEWAEEVDLMARLHDFFYFNEEGTAAWFPSVSFGGEFGGGAGASIFHHNLFGKREAIDASFLASTEGYEAKAAYASSPTDEVPFKFEFGATDDDKVEIYAIAGPGGEPLTGVETDDGDDDDYELRSFHGRITANVDLPGIYSMAPYLRGEVSKAKSRDSLLRQLEGMNEEVGLVAGGVTLVADRRDQPVRTSKGWYVESSLEAGIAPEKTDDGDRFGHTSYSLDARMYVPLHAPHRVLMLRQYLHRIDELGGNEVAFYHEPVLDVNNSLRAYKRYRFRDRGAMVTNIEYRYPVWRTWDAYVFADGGQTFDEYADIDVDDFEYAGGTGIRFLSANRLKFLLLVGFGSDGAEVIFGLSQEF